MSPCLSRMFRKTSRAMDEGQSAGWALVLSAPAPGKSRVHACATRTHTSPGESADSSTLGAAVRPEPPSTGTGL